MARAENTQLIDAFEEFYRNHYHTEIGTLARKYPHEQRSLFIDWDDLHDFDPELADNYRSQPAQIQEYAEEALRLYDTPTDVSLGHAHVRIRGLDETTAIRDIDAHHRGRLLAVEGVVQHATDVRAKITEAAFECQRCGTLTRIPQTGEGFQEPPECMGCERKGPFKINHDQSDFVDAQTIELLDDPANLSEGTVPRDIEVFLEDDIAGESATGDRVRVTGVLHLNRNDTNQRKGVFTPYLDGISVESLRHERSTGDRNRPISTDDLEEYVDSAAVAIGTLPENAREEETKCKLVTPFIEALGWNKYDGTEVRLEYTDSKTEHRPDYALFGPESGSPVVIVEAKRFGTALSGKEQQLYDYLRVFSAEWGVLTNGEEFYIYRRIGDDQLPENLAEIPIEDVPNASIIDSLRRNIFYDQDSPT